MGLFKKRLKKPKKYTILFRIGITLKSKYRIYRNFKTLEEAEKERKKLLKDIKTKTFFRFNGEDIRSEDVLAIGVYEKPIEGEII